MIDIQAEINRVESRLSNSKTPQADLRIAWIDALTRLDHCDDIRTALTTLCTQLIQRFCKKGTTVSELLKPILDSIYQTKKELSD